MTDKVRCKMCAPADLESGARPTRRSTTRCRLTYFDLWEVERPFLATHFAPNGLDLIMRTLGAEHLPTISTAKAKGERAATSSSYMVRFTIDICIRTKGWSMQRRSVEEEESCHFGPHIRSFASCIPIMAFRNHHIQCAERLIRRRSWWFWEMARFELMTFKMWFSLLR